jgi:translation initiation factor IF-3
MKLIDITDFDNISESEVHQISLIGKNGQQIAIHESNDGFIVRGVEGFDLILIHGDNTRRGRW